MQPIQEDTVHTSTVSTLQLDNACPFALKLKKKELERIGVLFHFVQMMDIAIAGGQERILHRTEVGCLTFWKITGKSVGHRNSEPTLILTNSYKNLAILLVQRVSKILSFNLF